MPITITITAENLVEALRLLTVQLGAPVSVTKAPESAPSSQETTQDAPIPVKEEVKSAPSQEKVPEYVNDIVAFRAEIKKIALPLMNDEEKALPPKEGEMALVKRLFAAAGVKNSNSVDGAKRTEFLKAIPQWLAKA